MAAENAIETRNLKKVYGKKTSRFEALKGVDIAVKEGESVAIVGKSGSGKSTLMHLLALLDRPTSGTILVGGRKATTLKDRDLNELRNKEFGFVFQQFFMNPNNTVLDNVTLPLKIAGVGRKERRERAKAALETVELGDKLRNKAKDLSGGQQQRVCIARALINNPRIIFADEPTGNLDSGTSDKIQDLLFSLNKDHGITLIIVTHDPELAQRADRRIHIRDGEVIKDTDDYPASVREKAQKEIEAKKAKLAAEEEKAAKKLEAYRAKADAKLAAKEETK